MSAADISARLYTHEHYHFAVIKLMSKREYKTPDDIFMDVRAMLLEPRTVLLTKDDLVLSKSALVPYTFLSESSRQVISELFESSDVRKRQRVCPHTGSYVELPNISIDLQQCQRLVLSALYTVLCTAYHENRTSAVAIFDALVPLFMRSFKINYDEVVEACAPHGYAALPDMV